MRHRLFWESGEDLFAGKLEPGVILAVKWAVAETAGAGVPK